MNMLVNDCVVDSESDEYDDLALYSGDEDEM